MPKAWRSFEMLNSLAGFGYLLVSAVAAAAAVRDSRAKRRHWVGIALIFIGLAAWRLAAGEAALQDQLREAAEGRGLYHSRGELQRPLIAFTLLLGAPLLALLIIRSRRAMVAWTVFVTRIAALLLVGYTAVRAVSLHAVDALVYRSFGPIHLNHLLDGGMTLTCLAGAIAAAFRVRVGRKAPAQERWRR